MMFLSKTIVLQKQGKSSLNWRQVTLMSNNDESLFEVREYYGQKKTSYMREVLKLTFDTVGVAVMNFNNTIYSREYDGYEQVEALCTEAKNVPFITFKPPAFKHSNKTPYIEQYTNAERPAAIAAPEGERLYIRFGCESLTSIKAVSATNKPVELSENVNKKILDQVKIGQIENGVIEAYILGENIVITDIASINGIEIKLPYSQRLQRAKDVFGLRRGFDYPGIMTEVEELKSSNAKYFLVKKNTPTSMADGCFTIPNFYTVACVILNNQRSGKNKHFAYFIGEENYIYIGSFWYPKHIDENSRVHIGFNELENGMPTKIWLSPFQPYNFDNISEEGVEDDQMENYKETWIGL